MRKTKFVALFALVFFLSCKKDCTIPDVDNTKTDETETKAYLRENPEVVHALKFIVRYNIDESKPEYGFLISSCGKVLSYQFEKNPDRTLGPGTYEDVVSYFDAAIVKKDSEIPGDLVMKTDKMSIELMKEYDKIATENIYSKGAEGLGVCNIHHMQKSDPGAEDVSFYPMRLFEGQYLNTWYVKDSDSPGKILENLDEILNGSGGLVRAYWEHYGL